MRLTLKNFLELPKVFDNIITYQSNLLNNNFSNNLYNVVNGSV